jgi:hypothetical protein
MAEYLTVADMVMLILRHPAAGMVIVIHIGDDGAEQVDGLCQSLPRVESG